VKHERSLSHSDKVALDVQSLGDEKPDTRSPIERFRTAPKKSLSVTDLVSPAWCELQYWYTLKFHGRKKQTPEMKRGSAVHKELEDELYTTVKVEIKTKEDAWGLRIWNVIQGLRTLEEIGHTRELEVWGIIEGLPVNGVIDEVSFICPDTELEAELQKKKASSKEGLPPDQTTLNDFFRALGGTSIAAATRSKRRSASNKIYICDVKTRSVRTLPKGAAFHSTKMQLMFYHHLLGNLATNQVDFSVLLDRYSLNGDTPFSDSFIAQIGSLNDETFSPSGSNGTAETSTQSSQDSMSMLLGHNSLSQLWSLMISSFQRVLPHGRDSISNLLRAEYRSQDQGEILGSSTLAMDEDVLKLYLEHEMKWWKGEREPMGVVIEEAYKCKSCEFAEICEWRLARVEEAREKSKANKKAITEIKKWEV
jgi:exonuclease V